MGVTFCRMAPDEPAVVCQGCGVKHSTGRLETLPDALNIEPTDLHLCDECIGGLKSQMCGGTVTPGARGGKVSRSHPDQSKRAAATVESGTQQAALLAFVASHCSAAPSLLNQANVLYGSTCAEAAGPLSEAVGHTVSRNQTATRMGELRDKGLVEEYRVDGRLVMRTTEGENEGQVWILTAAGAVEASRLAR